MNDEFWEQFRQIPGFDCVAMKHRAQERIHRETEGMSDDELIAYYNRVGRAFRENGKIPSSETVHMALNDEPAPYAKPE